MDKTVAELWHQLDELSENINNKRKSLALARKDRRETKELQRDELEVHPAILSLNSKECHICPHD